MAERTENYIQFIHQSQIYATNNKYRVCLCDNGYTLIMHYCVKSS